MLLALNYCPAQDTWPWRVPFFNDSSKYKIVESLPGGAEATDFLWTRPAVVKGQLASPLHSAAVAVSGGAAKLPQLQLRLLLSEAAHSHVMFVGTMGREETKMVFCWRWAVVLLLSRLVDDYML